MAHMFGRLMRIGGQGTAENRWWTAGGLDPASVTAAYQPVGAASYAASLLNLVNPATHALSDTGGIAPTWTSALGWAGANGKYLITDILPTANTSIVIKFSGWTTGYHTGANNSNGIAINPTFFRKGGTLSGVAGISSGTIAVAAQKAYHNGSFVGDIPAGSMAALVFYLLAQNFNGGPNGNCTGYIQAIAFYSVDITSYLAAIQAALALLPPFDDAPLMGGAFSYSSSIEA
jgi:hypothetical protein